MRFADEDLRDRRASARALEHLLASARPKSTEISSNSTPFASSSALARQQ